MFNLTDIVVLALFLFYVIDGWRKGVLRTLIAPFAFGVSLVLGYLYFKRTHNTIISFAISILGPIVIGTIASWFLQIQNAITGADQKPSSLSRCLGGIINLVWSGMFLILIILMLAFGPMRLAALNVIRENILQSQTCAILTPHVKNYLPVSPEDEPSRPIAKQKPSDEYQALMEDPRIKDLNADPEVQELIQQKDYIKLLQNPKFAKILEDPQLITKLFQMKRNMGDVN